MKHALALALLAACESTTAIDLELLPSPELNSVADLVSRIDTIVVVVDAAAGRLYPLDAERLDGDVQIKNADGDPGDLELVARVAMPADRLPRIRIERGGLPDVPLHVRVLGSVEPGTEMARGGATGVTFTDSEITTVAMPFNLLPRFLPLMVTEVAPGDGEIVPCDVKLDVITLFSRAVDAATITPPGRVVVTELGAGDIAVENLAVMSNAVTFEPAEIVQAYRLTIASDVTDTTGAHLDQVPAMAGLQPFSEDYHLECSGTSSPMMPWCSPSAPMAPCPGPPGRFRCEAGTCVPASCSNATCAGGFVCDPTTLACELDCRLYDGAACPVERPTCTPTGTCE
jgi:hypothetical protein